MKSKLSLFKAFVIFGSLILATNAYALIGGYLSQQFPIIETNDNGHAIAYSTPEDRSFIVKKFDRIGNTEWHKSYSITSGSIPFTINQTSDGGYIVGGSSGVYAWIIKINSTGALEWEEEFGYGGKDEIYSITQTSDGGYLAAGSTHNGFDYDCLIVKLNSSGQLIWSKELAFNGGYQDYFSKAIETSDGGYLAAGVCSYRNPYLNYGRVFAKIDSNGNLVWHKIYNGNSNIVDIVETSDGGFITNGKSNNQACLTKLTQNGSFEWQKVYENNQFTVGPTIGLVKALGNEYILGGNAYYQDPQTGYYIFKGFIIKTDSNGDIVWQKSYDDQSFYGPGSISIDYDGSFMATGHRQYGTGSNMSTFNIEQDGSVFCCQSVMVDDFQATVYTESINEVSNLDYWIADSTFSLPTTSATVTNVSSNYGEFCPGLGVSATPAILSHSNQAPLIDVLIDGPSLACSNTTTITLTDEYGVFNMAVPSFGTTVQLEAWKNKNDPDSQRTYTIDVVATDELNVTSTATTEVLVKK